MINILQYRYLGNIPFTSFTQYEIEYLNVIPELTLFIIQSLRYLNWIKHNTAFIIQLHKIVIIVHVALAVTFWLSMVLERNTLFPPLVPCITLQTIYDKNPFPLCTLISLICFINFYLDMRLWNLKTSIKYYTDVTQWHFSLYGS